MKKDTIIYMLLALSGYVFMYLAITFATMEYNVFNWHSSSRFVLIFIGTFIGGITTFLKWFTKNE